MINLNHFFKLFLLVGWIPILLGFEAYAIEGKTLRIAVILRAADRHNNPTYPLSSGLEAAKSLFEKEHPEISIRLKYYHHGHTLESVVNASNQIVTDGNSAAFGGETSEESIAISEILNRNKIVFITPTSSNPKVSEGKPFAFRGGFSDKAVATGLARMMLNKYKPSSIGLIHNISSPYTDYLCQQFKATYETETMNLPGSVKPPLYEELVLKDTLFFDEQIDRFIEKKVSHVAMLTQQDDFIKFGLQAAKKGLFPVYVGSDGWGLNENIYRKLVLPSASPEKFIGFRNTYWKEDSRSQLADSFKQVYESRENKKPDAVTAVSFDSAWVLFTAMMNAKNAADGVSVLESMKKIKDLPLVTTQAFTFGSDNSPIRDLIIYKIDGKGIRYEASIK